MQTRRSFMMGAATAAMAGTANAQGLSDRPIRIVVPYGPGGTSDIVARALQAPLAKALQRTLIVENKAGATGSIAARYVASSAPDGTAVLVPNTGNILAPFMQDKASFIDYRTMFVPVAQVADVPMVMVVSGDMPAKNVAEFLAYVKANPGKVNYGTAGVGSFGHLAGELLQKMTGTKMETVPYATGSQTDLAVANGEVKMMINSLPDARVAIGMGKG
ncbi:MAG: tripartite tricarboxylate transporter substrate binding protein, partial [Proteobacteria bacterium]|nr:tripartite tricarboxylate transporter substrate binding protein [Pseudomonadota bacterium]